MSSFLVRRWNIFSFNLIKKSLKNIFPQALPVPRKCGSIVKSFLRLPLECPQRFLPKWPTPLLIMQVVPLLTRFWKLVVQPVHPASMSSKGPARLMRRHMIKVMGRAIPPSFSSPNSAVPEPRVPINPCDLIRMLNIDEGFVLVDNTSKILQRQSVL